MSRADDIDRSNERQSERLRWMTECEDVGRPLGEWQQLRDERAAAAAPDAPLPLRAEPTRDPQSMRDRVEALGLPYPGKHVAWALGNMIRDRWLKHPISRGALPSKVLRGKTNNRGSHCFAVYPPDFATEMDDVICSVLQSPQGWLPFPEEGA